MRRRRILRAFARQARGALVGVFWLDFGAVQFFGNFPFRREIFILALRLSSRNPVDTS